MVEWDSSSDLKIWPIFLHELFEEKFHATKPRQAEIPPITSAMKQLSNTNKGKSEQVLISNM